MSNYTEFDKKALNKLLKIETELSARLGLLATDLSKSHSRDLDEQAIERENDEVVVKLESDEEQELKQVRAAITRIDHGKYHECSICGREISLERLDAIPYTTVCISCAKG